MALKLFKSTLHTTNETIVELGLSKDTLRRYRKNNILKKGIDWQYGDAYGRSILYNLDNVREALHKHAVRRLEIA